ncbi:MAG: PIN domain-containing protein [Fimbriimonadia bacterium]|nr:PIN domain-containing protein [Fimbriimonadia bacterium]
MCSVHSIVEVVYLTEKGRLPMQALNSLLAALNDNASGFSVVSLDLEVCKSVQSVSREAIPDMPDRIITATAVLLQLPLVTRDKKIADAGFTTIW